ncbi:DUF2147 domain-containing protein [Parapedobacter sp. GCM10030251]|uniref:DUF2147 domain-containing protein n=1 Tax=Parapedobacter sp. GCM10030251 TaxID=3273419 RepID=UPI00360A670F
MENFIKGRWVLFLLAVLAFHMAQAQTASDKITGIWLSENKDGKIEVYKSGDKYFGKLIWGKDMYEADGKTSRKDDKNQDAKLRSRKLKDLVILNNFVYSDGVWEDGKIYDPYSGKTYSCTIKLKDGKLNIRGYIGVSLLGKTTVWHRVK